MTAGVTGRPSRPGVSVVIAAWTAPGAAIDCVRSLASQMAADADEVIVARGGPIDEAALSAAAGALSLMDIPMPAGTTVPLLRAAGLAAANGRIVAFLEDHCRCAPTWRDAIVEAHEHPVVAVGGPVDLAPGGRPLDWAVYFYDYGRFAPPMKGGAATALSGANATYKRDWLTRLPGVGSDGILEVALEQAVRDGRLGQILAPDAVVLSARRSTAGQAITLALSLARMYAAGRVARAAPARRALLAAGTPLLPALMGLRVVSAALRTRRHLGRLVLAGPWLLALLCAWAAGELTGYVAGAGTSSSQWK